MNPSLRHHVPAAVSCGVLAAAWWATAAALEALGVGPLVVLAAATAVSLLAGLAAARAIHPTLFAEFRELMSLSRQSTDPAAPAATTDDALPTGAKE